MLVKHTKKGSIVKFYGVLYVRCHYDRSSKMYMLIKESEHQGPCQYSESAIRYLSGDTEVETV
jgi:hypothetical protein